jgi:CelD/BcsL family acetyltransferase involved in cellulose biosynthesis
MEFLRLERPTTNLPAQHDLADVRWARFVESSPAATIFHHPAWTAVLTGTYGYRPVVLALGDAHGEIRAGAVFLDVRSRLTGRRLVSLPFTDHSPVLARDDDALREFAAALVDWRARAGVPRLEVHAELPDLPGVHRVPEGVRHLLPLDRPPEELYRSLKGKQVERGIRKAERSGVTVTLERSEPAVDTFYRLHCLTRRRQGVPVQPRRFFRELFSRLVAEGHGFVAIARHEGAAIAAAVFLGWNGHLVYKYGASDARSWSLRPNNLLFWKVIEQACADGYRLLDFGKTELDNEGLRDFKRHWGAEEVDLGYATLADRSPSPDAGPGGIAARVLSASPVFVTRAAGELLYRHFA